MAVETKRSREPEEPEEPKEWEDPERHEELEKPEEPEEHEVFDGYEEGDHVAIYGECGQARQLFEDARESGIVFLDEGTHRFTLENGASLTVYASPYVPSDPGFSYNRLDGHDFQIEKGTDVVITHGPPEGILDTPVGVEKKRPGCQTLFAALAKARPRLHCFGYIHNAWGARLVTWRKNQVPCRSYMWDIVNKASPVIQALPGLAGSESDDPDTLKEKKDKLECIFRERFHETSHCTGDKHPLKFGSQTLFVNAAIMGTEEHPVQPPWIVDVELPKAN